MGNKITPAYHSDVTLCADHNGDDDLLPPTAPVILKLSIEGVIGTQKLNEETLERILIESRRGLLSNNRVKAILLYINSPGGAASDSNSIYHQIVEYKNQYKVPVYAFANSLCASGGYEIACAGDMIYAAPVSIIGSVGAKIGPFFNFKDLMTRYGVNAVTIAKGLDKDMMSPFRAWKENEDESLNNIVDAEYHRFVDLVASSRPRLDKSKLINEYGAKVFDTETSYEYGYVDEKDATLRATLKELAMKANLGETYQVVEINVRPTLLSNLLQNKWMKSDAEHLLNPLGLKNPSRGLILHYHEL